MKWKQLIFNKLFRTFPWIEESIWLSNLKKKHFVNWRNNALYIQVTPYIKNNNKAEKQGLGLGLFISKNLLAKSNGQIKFSHRESGGGMVKIVLSKDQLNLLK